MVNRDKTTCSKKRQVSKLLLLRPAVLSDEEHEIELRRAEAAYPGCRIAVWDGGREPRPGLRRIIGMRRQRFDLCIIERGSADRGYLRPKLIAALLGAPIRFEGAAWSPLSLLGNVLSILLYCARLAWGTVWSRVATFACVAPNVLQRAILELASLSRMGTFVALERCPVCGGENHERRTLGLWIYYLRCGDCGLIHASRWASDCWRMRVPQPRLLRSMGEKRQNPNGIRQSLVFHRGEGFLYLSVYESRFGKAKGKLLDLSCGDGGRVAVASDRGWEARGIDSVGPRSICTAKRAKKKGYFYLLEPEERFDLILALDVLHRFPDPGAFLEQLRKLCGPGTVVLIRTLDGSKALQEDPFLWPPQNVCLLDERLLLRLCEKAGFNICCLDALVDANSLEVWMVAGDAHID